MEGTSTMTQYTKLCSKLNCEFNEKYKEMKKAFFIEQLKKRKLEDAYLYTLRCTPLKGYGISQYNRIEKVKLIDVLVDNIPSFNLFNSLEEAKAYALKDINEDIECLNKKQKFSEENKKIVEGWTDDTI